MYHNHLFCQYKNEIVKIIFFQQKFIGKWKMDGKYAGKTKDGCRVKEWRVTLGIPLAGSAVSSFVPV